MTAYLYPQDGGWMLQIDTLGIYVDSKEEGIDLCRALAPARGITTLKVSDINSRLIDEQ